MTTCERNNQIIQDENNLIWFLKEANKKNIEARHDNTNSEFKIFDLVF